MGTAHGTERYFQGTLGTPVCKRRACLKHRHDKKDTEFTATEAAPHRGQSGGAERTLTMLLISVRLEYACCSSVHRATALSSASSDPAVFGACTHNETGRVACGRMRCA